jgi:3-oxoisoapionate decarboxylase
MTAAMLLEKAASFHIDVVQICDNIGLDHWSKADLSELGKTAKRIGIVLQTGTQGVTPDHLLKHLEIAQILSSNLLRTITDMPACKPDQSQVVAWIREILPAFEKAGVRIAIENHDRFSSTELVAIIKRIDSPFVGICLDTVNSFGLMERPEDVIEKLAPYTINLHFKDFGIARISCKMGFTISGRPAGSGLLNLDYILDRLAAAGQSPDVILEQWPPFEETVEKTAASECQWAVQGIQFLANKLERRHAT